MVPRISDFMTVSPIVINEDASLIEARDAMEQHAIRYLPVQAAGKLVGVITDRDLAVAPVACDETGLRVRDLMCRDPYIVSPDAALADAAAQMAATREDCAIVARNSQVLGIFTATDALRILSQVFRYRPKAVA